MRRNLAWSAVVLVSILSTMGLVKAKPTYQGAITTSVKTQREHIQTQQGSFVDSSTITSVTLTNP